MKKTFRFASIITIIVVSTLFSCVDTEKNLYDSSFQMPTPMGEGFSAPDGFDWSTLTNKTLTVEVKDEFSISNSNQESGYYYLIEIYDKNPLYNNDAILLSNGVTQNNNNFITTINTFKGQKGIYIKQTDPRKRVEVYPFDIPEKSDNIICKLYYTNSTNRTSSTRSLASTRESDFEKPNYATIPSDAQEITQAQGNLMPNTSYKITSPFNGLITFSGNNNAENTKVYVASTWMIPRELTFQNGLEIIVMPNGKIESNQTLSFVNESMLTIMDNGNVTVNNISLTDKLGKLRNWGNLSLNNELKLSDGALLYNKGIITSPKLNIDADSRIVNDYKISISGDLNLPALANLENNGELSGKNMIVSSNSTITNNGKITFESISWTNPTIYNNCSIEATSSFKSNGCTMNFQKGHLKTPTIDSTNGSLNLDNGSMLEATQSADLKGTKFSGMGTATSMIKSPVITGQGFGYNGNLVIESNKHVEKNQWWDNFTIGEGVHITKIGESKVTIETCSGTVNEGNQGDTPGSNIPSFPIIMDDNQNYAYIYEDQWPFYGDYDLNDIVMVITNRKISTNTKNLVTKFELSIDLRAIGATKKIGAAIMLDAVKASEIKQKVTYKGNTIPQNFNLNALNIEDKQDYTVIPLFDDAHIAFGSNSYEPINTVNNSPNNTNNYKSISFTIQFDNPTLKAEAFNVNKLNIFIFTEGHKEKRKEIHVIGFQPSLLAETNIFGENNDNSSFSSNKYYISKEGLAWGIMVPTNLKWTQEYANIRDVYPEFESWVTSGGKNNDTWWNKFNNNKTFKNNKNQ